jgi:hypothetical protein
VALCPECADEYDATQAATQAEIMRVLAWFLLTGLLVAVTLVAAVAYALLYGI